MHEIEEEKSEESEEEEKKIGWRLRKAGKFADKGFSKVGSKIGNFGKKLNPFAKKKQEEDSDSSSDVHDKRA